MMNIALSLKKLFGVNEMRCVECPYYFWDDYEEIEICHADPNWPALCDYNDNFEEEYDGDF